MPTRGVEPPTILTDADAASPERVAPHRRTRNYLAGVLTSYAVVALTILYNLWLTPFTLRFLDREEYALFVFGNDLLTWLVLLDLGMTVGLRAQVAQLTGRPDTERMNQLASTTFFAQLILALLMIVAGGAMAWLAPRLFQVRPDLQGQASLVLLLLALGTALNFATQAFSSLLFAHQQIHYDNLIRILQITVRAVVTVALLVTGWKVLALAIASLAAVAFFSLLSVLRAYLAVPGLKISPRLGSRSLLWNDLKKLNLWYAVGNMATALIQSMDRLIAARFVSLASVTTLALTGRAYMLALLLLTPLTAAAHPALGQLIGEGKRARAFDAYRRLLLLSTGAATVAALSLWSGNAAFVARWVGAENYGGAWLDALMMLNLIAFSWVLPNRMALIVGLRARPQALTRLAEALLNLCLSVLLARRYGLVGIAAATTIAAALVSCWQFPRLVADYFERNLKEVLAKAVAPLVLPLLGLIALAVMMRLFVASRGGYAGALAAILTVGACGLFLLWRFAFDKEIRERALQVLHVPAHFSKRGR
ncbi:MAG TPA: MATE family efflux transporter [Pyrinomonadaceae bacterium]